MTFEEIAKELGITRQRAEQIYATAIAKMRRGLQRENITADVLNAELDNGDGKNTATRTNYDRYN